MNFDIITGLIRAFTPILVAWLVKRGLTPDDAGNMVTYGGDALIALATFGAAYFSIRRNQEKGQIAKTAALPGVKSIEVSPEAVPAGGFDEATAMKVKITSPVIVP